MVHPVLIIGGIAVAGWAFDKFGDAAEGSAKLTKWATIGGGVYVSFQALKATGAIK